jgi:hypothetical protein
MCFGVVHNFLELLLLFVLFIGIISLLTQRMSSMCSSQSTSTFLSCSRIFLQNSTPIPRSNIMCFHSTSVNFDALRSVIATVLIASVG